MDSFQDIDLIKFFKFEQAEWENVKESLVSQHYFLYFPKNSKLSCKPSCKRSFDLNDLYKLNQNEISNISNDILLEPLKDSLLIYVDSGSQVNITDTIDKLAQNYHTVLIRSISIIINENSSVEFIHDYDVPIPIYSSINVLIKRNSTLNLVYANSNVYKSINEIRYQLMGPNACVNHVDLTALKDNAQFALTIYQEHKNANATSKVNSRLILKEAAKSFYRGNIIIDELAENSKAEQKQLSLILSDDSKSCAIPSLQVKNNKVKCSHGAATGKIDQEQLWYLQSRGLDKKEAQNLIIEAFFSSANIIDNELTAAILEKFKKYIK